MSGNERHSQFPIEVSRSDIKIVFYSNKIKQGYAVNTSSPESFLNIDYNPSKQTVFIIFGWTNNARSNMCQTVKDAYLTTDEVNVFIVDWSKIADQEYAAAKFQLVFVGQVLAAMITDMVNNKLLTWDKLSIVGHSLGAHLAGITGKNLNGQADHIVGELIIYSENFVLS